MRMSPHHALGHDPSAVAGKSFDRQVLARVRELARPYKWQIVGFLATIVVDALVALVPVWLFKRIIEEGIPHKDKGLITLLTVLAMSAALADAGLSLAQRWWSSRIGEGLIYDLRVLLFDHVQRMPIAFFTRTQTGSLISRLNNDVVGAQQALTGTLGQVVSNAIVLVSTLAAMAVLEWRLTLLSLLVLPVFIIPAKRVGRRLQDITRQQMTLNASMNTTMTERFNVSGAQLVKLFGNHDRERDSFGDRAAKVRDTGIKSAMYGRMFFMALGLVAAVATAAIYGIGARLVISGSIKIGTLVALAAYVTRIYAPLTSLTNARVDLMTAFVSFDRVFEVLDAPRLVDDRLGAIDLTDVTGRVTFDGVTFRYPAGDQVSVASLEAQGASGSFEARNVDVLHNVSLDVAPGSMVAVVGPSGAGKSTLASLVPRLYDVTEGAVRIDGHDVRDVTMASLRGAIGVVAQDPHLFHESVAANLRYARPDASLEDLRAACAAAQILEVVMSLPEGFDTIVGERGYRLSGGEKQRLAIARMILKNPAIVILDEATSHLDAENESLVQDALAKMLVGRTSIVIAHRLSTVRAADEIVVLDGGQIVERGTHDSLVEASGLYADLYQTLTSN